MLTCLLGLVLKPYQIGAKGKWTEREIKELLSKFYLYFIVKNLTKISDNKMSQESKLSDLTGHYLGLAEFSNK